MPLVQFNPLIGPYQVLPRRNRVDLGAMTIKGYSAFPKTPALLEPHHQIAYCHTLFGGVLPLCRGAVCVFYSPSRLSNFCELNYNDQKIWQTFACNIRKRWTAVSTVLSLIISVYPDLPHWRSIQQPQNAEPKLYNDGNNLTVYKSNSRGYITILSPWKWMQPNELCLLKRCYLQIFSFNLHIYLIYTCMNKIYL